MSIEIINIMNKNNIDIEKAIDIILTRLNITLSTRERQALVHEVVMMTI